MGLHHCLVARGRPPQLHTTEAQWASLLKKVEGLETGTSALNDEAVWTFLCAYGYAIENCGDVLARLLCENRVPVSSGDLWLESEPFPPRENEGNTMVDLAAGNLRPRLPTKSGVEFDPAHAGPESWAVLVECKWLSDMSAYTKYDPLRGQLLRVIENALALQGGDRRPQSSHFTLLTPRVFKEHPRARGYGLLFNAYSETPALIANDLSVHRHPVRSMPPDWKYPDLSERISALRLHWVDFESVIASMPSSEFKAELIRVAQRDGTLLDAGSF